MDLRKSTLRYLHSVFDDDPGASLGLIIENEVSFDWTIRDLTLTVDGQAIDLRYRALNDIATDLRRLGLAASVPGHLLNRSAASLLDGAGRGTRVELPVQNSVLWALSLPGALAQLEGQRSIAEALAQLNFMTAAGGWLDLWGRYFDVPRLDGQDDSAYAAFIRREVLRIRSNVFAMQTAVKDWTGHDVYIREPWKELFIWGKSRWDEVDSRWQDGNFYTFGTIQPRAALPDSAWEEIAPVLQRNRALGCYLFPGAFAIPGMLVTPNPGDIPVHSMVTDSYPADVDANLTLTVGYRLTQDIWYGFGVVSDSPIWVGGWDDRTWNSGGRVYPVGYARTDIPA